MISAPEIGARLVILARNTAAQQAIPDKTGLYTQVIRRKSSNG
jgi:hypothetical protein